MEVYVGLDVSLKETAICVVDGSGKIVSEGKVLSEPLALAEFLRAKAGNAKRIGLETGPTTTWLWHELRAQIDARVPFLERDLVAHRANGKASERHGVPPQRSFSRRPCESRDPEQPTSAATLDSRS